MQITTCGGGGSDEEQILRQISNFPEMFVFHGKIYDKKRLKNIYQSADIFAMPSRNETFGLVYVEAMLQSLPILYTQNEGIDGFYAENIGEKVSRHADVEEIEHSLLRIMNNYSSYRIPLEKLIHNHNWKNIALDYQNVYSSLSNINN
jgi:glycosyltransferase involved in cell wall biosynthesis